MNRALKKNRKLVRMMYEDEPYRRYNEPAYHPKKHNVFDIKTGDFKEVEFPIVNPITLHPNCQRARIREAKKEARRQHLRLANGL